MESCSATVPTTSYKSCRQSGVEAVRPSNSVSQSAARSYISVSKSGVEIDDLHSSLVFNSDSNSGVEIGLQAMSGHELKRTLPPLKRARGEAQFIFALRTFNIYSPQ